MNKTAMAVGELININHVREVVNSIGDGRKLTILFFDPMVQQCWASMREFDDASTNPRYNMMCFYGVNTLNVIGVPGKDEMEDFMLERDVISLPAMAFWDGIAWKTALVSDDVNTVLEKHRQ